MVAAQRPKTVNRQDACKKLLTLLKKHYGAVPKTPELPVLNTFLFAACLENVPVPAAHAAYDGIFQSFHDLNEARVSSIDELEKVFQSLPHPDWRAMRVRNILQFVFETTYSFDLEPFKRKTLELAAKQLNKLKFLTPFIREYVLHQTLGAHLLPIDDRMHAALVWLDLTARDSTAEQTSETLKSFVRKAEGDEFCRYLRAWATDPTLETKFAAALRPPGADDPPISTAARLQDLFTPGEPAKVRTRRAAAAVAAAPPADPPAPPPAKTPKSAAKSAAATVNGARKTAASSESKSEAKAEPKPEPKAEAKPAKKPKGRTAN